MNKTISLVAALMMVSGSVAAQTFDEAFNAQRGMNGKGHSFTFEGKSYTTDHPEEVAAAAPANAANAKQLLADAKAQYAKALEVDFGWTLTKGLLSSANKALDAGEFRKSMELSARAQYHSRMGVAQYHQSQQEWLMAVPN
ncbi:hypothetical protein OAD42_01100 [Oceanospirillaceae bacterium]|jgi:hypothetical protein|nr:hypothetical protein [Oceanospirillaceae bacterium]MDB9957659.1 hypothetical protein [Oceanospirillaceae bacterium]MDC1340178.1 hypothetical protein [Oceanospirillaceae bacterium]